jgi:fumarylacetoacetase
LPVGYHGRSSTIVPSGTSLRRPHGQRKSPSDASPVFGPCTRLDYELEMGYVIGGAPNELGRPVTTAEAPERLFGMVILNDWSGTCPTRGPGRRGHRLINRPVRTLTIRLPLHPRSTTVPARDIQTWEYVPLGPFLSKNFGSTISPWVVEFAALEPFAQRPTPAQRDTPVLPYLRDPDTKAYNVNLKVEIKRESPPFASLS